METQQGTLDHSLLYEEFIKTVLSGDAKCSFSNENENDSLTYKANLIHLLCSRLVSCTAWINIFCSLITQGKDYCFSSISFKKLFRQIRLLIGKNRIVAGSGERMQAFWNKLSPHLLSCHSFFIFLLWPQSIRWLTIFAQCALRPVLGTMRKTKTKRVSLFQVIIRKRKIGYQVYSSPYLTFSNELYIWKAWSSAKNSSLKPPLFSNTTFIRPGGELKFPNKFILINECRTISLHWHLLCNSINLRPQSQMCKKAVSLFFSITWFLFWALILWD